MLPRSKVDFYSTGEDATLLWLGNPDCDAAHRSLLAWLIDCGAPFLTPELASNSRVKGNLGESIAFVVGYDHVFSDDRYHAYAANAFFPLRNISTPDIDIVWIYFADNPSEDRLLIQEVKTTGDLRLALADDLVDDYDKLFGTNPQVTLHTRLQAIKTKLKRGERAPELAGRISTLAGQSPSTSPQVTLLPTLVHERVGCDPRSKFLLVRTTLVGRGWSPGGISCWSIALSEINDRLVRLATGLA